MSKNAPPPALELLAPAGSETAFFAAVEAGADAVYLGLRQANARMRAQNFTMTQLETLIPYAHHRGVRVHITFNTLVKQRELSQILLLLMQLEALGPDALIVQDYGVAMLAARYAPGLPLHASTQMTVLNSAGVKLLENLGFARAILARECTLEEIVTIVRAGAIGIEVFVHGALCYSYSGQCYFSSYLGGASANRGRCTQPCRRSYQAGKKEGAFFSPKDQCLIDRLPELARAGVTALKIEGRLKGEAYVSEVVASYRSAIDALPARADPSLVQRAENDFGRAKSHGHLDVKLTGPLVNPDRTAGAGRYLGKVKRLERGELVFSSVSKLTAGDRLRITPKFEGEREGFSLKQFKMETSGGGVHHYRVPFAGKAKAGELVFLVGRKEAKPKTTLARLEADFRKRPRSTPRLSEKADRYLTALASELQGHAQRVRRFPRRFIRVALPPSARDIIRLLDRRVDEYIVPLKHREIYSLPRSARNRVVLRIPVFLRERELGATGQRIRQAIQRGFTRFLVGNPSHLVLLAPFPEARIQIDYTFGVLNSAALTALVSLGAETVTVSLESDAANLGDLVKASRGFPMELVAYGRPPLFTSRIDPPLPTGRGGRDIQRQDDIFQVEKLDKLTIVVPKTPFALMGALKPHQVESFAALRLELSGGELQHSAYNSLRTAVAKWTPVRGARPFNYRRTGDLK